MLCGEVERGAFALPSQTPPPRSHNNVPLYDAPELCFGKQGPNVGPSPLTVTFLLGGEGLGNPFETNSKQLAFTTQH